MCSVAYGELVEQTDGARLALLLLGSFEAMVDEVVHALAEQGHHNVSATHAFALQAIDDGADSAAKLARAMGVTRQAAAKTVEAVEGLGYIERIANPTDARGKRLQVTPRGEDMMRIGGKEFDAIRDRWAAEVGTRRIEHLQATLATFLDSNARRSMRDSR